MRLALILLAVGGVGAAFVSDWFIRALQPAIEQLHISKEFAGLVIVAIAGNAVENVTGLVLATRASTTSRSASSRTPSPRSPPSCSRRSCSSRCCSPTT